MTEMIGYREVLRMEAGGKDLDAIHQCTGAGLREEIVICNVNSLFFHSREIFPSLLFV